VRLRLALLMACGAFAGCNAVDIVPPGQNTLGGKVEFYMSGGFAGIRQSLIVDDNGLIIVQDDKRGKLVRGQLDPVRQAEIRAAFMKIDTEAGTMTQRLDALCADCFQYTIKSTVGGKRHQVVVNSAVFQDSPYHEIVKALVQILRETLSSQPK